MPILIFLLKLIASLLFLNSVFSVVGFALCPKIYPPEFGSRLKFFAIHLAVIIALPLLIH
jgi:hypothetical protein